MGINNFYKPDFSPLPGWFTTKGRKHHTGAVYLNGAWLTSAVLDRLLHHAETLVIEGSSYRMKDRLET